MKGGCRHRPQGAVRTSRYMAVPHADIDYAYFTDGGMKHANEVGNEEREDESKSLTVLAMKDSLNGTWAYPVTKKGTRDETWVVKAIVDDLDSFGLQKCRISFKGDSEASIKDVQRSVAIERVARGGPGAGTALESSPVGDSNNNGRAERAIQEIGGVTRTLRSALERRIH